MLGWHTSYPDSFLGFMLFVSKNKSCRSVWDIRQPTPLCDLITRGYPSERVYRGSLAPLCNKESFRDLITASSQNLHDDPAWAHVTSAGMNRKIARPQRRACRRHVPSTIAWRTCLSAQSKPSLTSVSARKWHGLLMERSFQDALSCSF